MASMSYGLRAQTSEYMKNRRRRFNSRMPVLFVGGD